MLQVCFGTKEFFKMFKWLLSDADVETKADDPTPVHVQHGEQHRIWSSSL